MEQFTKTVVTKLLGEQYPHLRRAAIVYATVRTAQEAEQPTWYRYGLRLLDSFGAELVGVPILPNVHSKRALAVGTTVAVALPFGELAPVILEEVLL